MVRIKCYLSAFSRTIKQILAYLKITLLCINLPTFHQQVAFRRRSTKSFRTNPHYVLFATRDNHHLQTVSIRPLARSYMSKNSLSLTAHFFSLDFFCCCCGLASCRLQSLLHGMSRKGIDFLPCRVVFSVIQTAFCLLPKNLSFVTGYR